ncbi:MAG: stage V sporulation T C-terminal domain-containing protein [Oscillospiraceae bacterium]|nr:stage V sporulation T C-terminal domain-containing protein [Oscillospiraceae bacterium]
MKATGIVRRIDDLGRVVIPKEIRRTMRIRDGDPLEIYTAGDGEVIFKKYSPIGELSAMAMQYVDVLVKCTEFPIVVCDRDHCVAAAGTSKKEVLERRVTTWLEDLVESRKSFISAKGSPEGQPPLEGVDHNAAIVIPILSAGDIAGSVIMLSNDSAVIPNECDIKLVTVAAGFLGKQME